MIRTSLALISILWCLTLSANQDLPSFGDSTSGIISLEQEHRLGQQFLRSIRAQAPTLDDPILQDFLEHLIYRLASYSQLKDRRLDLVIIRNGSLNAFAAPGGIVGVHDGLFRYAETEHEMSAILSHELAHLSQRHFARRVAEGKKGAAINIAGLLAAVVLAATTGGDAALAAMTGSRGLAQNQSLKYSREREAEADRIGIYTLDNAGMDPRAMAYMFERLQRASRYSTGNNIPEFLRTHPVTNDRVADSYNQTQNYPKKQFPASLDYQLMRVRARAVTSGNLQQEVARFQADFEGSTDAIEKTANQYGLVISLTDSLAFDKARGNIRELREQHPLNIPFRIAEAEIYTRAQQPEIALDLLKEALEVSPNNYPLSATYAQTFLAARKPHAALEVLIPLSVKRPNDEYVWYLLAEAYGLANNIPGVHESRAEFFVLNGNYDQAIKQLGYALPLVRHNFQQTARIKQRLEDIWLMKDGG
jgi:beta-barrel assembly-enhancing protease